MHSLPFLCTLPWNLALVCTWQTEWLLNNCYLRAKYTVLPTQSAIPTRRLQYSLQLPRDRGDNTTKRYCIGSKNTWETLWQRIIYMLCLETNNMRKDDLRKKHKLQNKWICVLIFPSNTDCKTSPSTEGVYCHHLEGITENASQIETEWLFSLAELWLTLFQWRTCRVIIPASNHLAGADPPTGWRSKGHQVKVKLNYFF